jgi:hypothetical protein
VGWGKGPTFSFGGAKEQEKGIVAVCYFSTGSLPLEQIGFQWFVAK